jgi:4-hydroxy-4-methyl-2-oxoglutarate aldolase
MTYQIGDRPSANSDVDEAIELLRGRSTGTLGHWKSLGYAHGLEPLLRPAHAVGEVVTARISAFDASSVHYAVSLLQPGDVLVVDTGGETKRACWGGATSYAAYQAGAAGVIVDGPVTDWDEITIMGVPTWARGMTSLTYRAAPDNVEPEGGVNIPIRVSGALVLPGDIAFADSDGVFFLGRNEVLVESRRLVERATNERETTWRELANGQRLFDIKGQRARYEEMAVRINSGDER